MKIAAEEHLCIERNIRKLDYPDCWDSPSFAHNLYWAFEGFPNQDKLQQAGTQVKRMVASKNGGLSPLPGGKFFLETSGLQKLAYEAIKEDLFPETQCLLLKQLCEERCSKLFLPYDIFAGDGPNFAEAFVILSKVGGQVSMKVIKTWLNGWATSHRMHEDVILGCLLGCNDASDSMSHYVICPHVYAFLGFLFSGVSEDPLIRLGMKSPEIFSIKVISCLFSAYHALKGEVRCGKINVHAVNWLNSAWSVFANALKAEAGEMRLDTRSFSLPKFISFLIPGGAYCPPENSTAIEDTQ